MSESEIRNLLLIGMDITPLARSSKMAGYKVYTADYFGDQDLRSVSEDLYSIIEQRKGSSCGRLSIDFNVKTLLRGAKEISSRNPIDAILISSGLDDSYEVLCELLKIAPILGNSPEAIQKVRDKEKFTYELKRLRVPFPETTIVDNFSEASRASKEIGYPMMIKPLRSFGGARIRKAESLKELEEAFKKLSHHRRRTVIQKYISGTAASVSVVSSGNDSIALTVNEQLIGLDLFGQGKPFRYSGNIVPLSASGNAIPACKRLAERIVTHFELIGSNGVDLVISRDDIPYVVEVNPRFQGTLECVENVLGINMVEAHVKACTNGLLPRIPSTIPKFCTRLILFALHRSVVPDLSRYAEVRDIPLPGVIIEKGEPVCSIIAVGKDRDSSLAKARNVAERITSSLELIQ